VAILRPAPPEPGWDRSPCSADLDVDLDLDADGRGCCHGDRSGAPVLGKGGSMQDRHLASGSVPALALSNAPGCDSAHPTRICGEIYGYPDRRAVNAIIGVEAKANGKPVDRHGRPLQRPGYSWSIRVNPQVGPEGTTDPSAQRLWGLGEEGCVSAKIDQVFIEIYPQVQDEPGHVQTDWTRYGGASHYYQPIRPGRRNWVLLRLPVRNDQDERHGNTGYVDGLITFRGRPVPDPKDNLVIRAWSHGRGPECGVKGFAASAEILRPNRQGTATYYRTPPLAAGRCGAVSQRYSIQITCKLLSGANRKTQHAEITKGRHRTRSFKF
jgi:hypothetical protein